MISNNDRENYSNGKRCERILMDITLKDNFQT